MAVRAERRKACGAYSFAVQWYRDRSVHSSDRRGKPVARMSVLVLVVVLGISVGLPAWVVSPGVFFPMSVADLLYLGGRYFALMAFLMLTFQYLWTAKIRFLERLRSYDGRVAAHRTLGFLGILVLGLHPILVLAAYDLIGMPLELDLPTVLGFGALVLLLVIAGSTFLGRIWRIRYESWKRLHWLTFPVLTLAFFHSLFLGSDIYAAARVVWFVIWGLHLTILLGKAVHKARVWLRTHRVVSVKPEVAGVTTLVMEKPEGRYLSGQFAFISLKLDKRWEAWHPFSLTSHEEEPCLSVSIKALGDFSGRIGEVRPGDRVKIDAAYGAFSPRLLPAGRYVMVAGGVGITPIYGALKELARRDPCPEVLLIYSAHHESDFLFRAELEQWFGERATWKLHLVCTSQPDWQGERGRITPDMVRRLCDGNLDGAFFLCGPLAMVDSVVRYLRAQGVSLSRIKREQFVFLP